MRLLLFSDLQLDAVHHSLPLAEAAEARRDARRVFLRICALARDLRVSALCGAGNLYDQNSATQATGDLLQEGFESVDPIPVCLAPGRTDWFRSSSRYADVAWSRNVHVFREPRFEGFELRGGGTIWGAAHVRPVHETGFLADIPVGFVWSGMAPHVALFHGVEHSDVAAGSVATAPFHRDDVHASGFDHALVGHRGRSHAPAPFSYGGGPVLVTIDAAGTVTEERYDVAASGSALPPPIVDLFAEPPWFTQVFDGPGPLVRPDPSRLTVLARFVRDVDADSLDPGQRDRMLRAGLCGLEE